MEEVHRLVYKWNILKDREQRTKKLLNRIEKKAKEEEVKLVRKDTTKIKKLKSR